MAQQIARNIPVSNYRCRHCAAAAYAVRMGGDIKTSRVIVHVEHENTIYWECPIRIQKKRFMEV